MTKTLIVEATGKVETFTDSEWGWMFEDDGTLWVHTGRKPGEWYYDHSIRFAGTYRAEEVRE